MSLPIKITFIRLKTGIFKAFGTRFLIFSTSDLYFPINIHGAFVEMPGEKMNWYEKNVECWMKIQQRKL